MILTELPDYETAYYCLLEIHIHLEYILNGY